MKKTLIAILALTMVACSRQNMFDHKKPVIAVSTLAWASISKEISGEKSHVHVMIENTIDPHEYVPAAIDLAKLQSANIIIANGGGYDPFIVHGKTKNNTLIDAFSFLPDSNATDMHVFLNISVVDKVSAELMQKLSELLPSDQENFQKNYRTFHQQLIKERDQLVNCSKRTHPLKMIHTEKIGTYLLGLAGITDITPDGIGDEDREPTAQGLLAAQQLFESHSAGGLIVNPQAENPRTKTLRAVAERNHIPVIEIAEVPSPEQSYLDWLGSIVQAIVSASKAAA